jgi:hypothetical protein
VARRSRWQDDTEETETGTPCARGRSCAEADYQGNPVLCPRAFCEKDREWISASITGLPENYTRLRLLLARSQQQQERVSGSREAPIPLATDIEAFMREIVHIACGWEEQVRAVASLSDHPDGHRRDGVALTQACRTLAAHLSILLTLAPEEKVRLMSLADLYDTDLDFSIWWDTAGDAWAYTTMDGTDAGLEFLRLNGRARGMLGLNRGRRRITEVPCDECQGSTLVQWEGFLGGWDPVIKCTNCPNAYIGPRFELLMGRIYKIQMERLGHAS